MENNNFKLSVIVPIYNIEEYLEKCIESVIDSTYTNLEIILVDDGSTDDSGQICDKYQQVDKRINVIHKKNGGLVSARKAGVKAATGEYVTFVDGDDFISNDLYESAISIIVESSADFICYGFSRCNAQGDICEICANELNNGTYTVGNVLSFYDVEKNSVSFRHSVCTKIFRTALFKAIIDDVDDSVTKAEDLNFTFAYLKKASSFCVDNSIAGYNYVDRSSSITHVYDYNNIEHTANYVTSSIKLCKAITESDAKEWNSVIYNEALNLILSDCIGCAFLHYGKKRIYGLLQYFKQLVQNDTFSMMLNRGISEGAFSGIRNTFANLLVKKKYLQALVFRIIFKNKI